MSRMTGTGTRQDVVWRWIPLKREREREEKRVYKKVQKLLSSSLSSFSTTTTTMMIPTTIGPGLLGDSSEFVYSCFRVHGSCPYVVRVGISVGSVVSPWTMMMMMTVPSSSSNRYLVVVVSAVSPWLSWFGQWIRIGLPGRNGGSCCRMVLGCLFFHLEQRLAKSSV